MRMLCESWSTGVTNKSESEEESKVCVCVFVRVFVRVVVSVCLKHGCTSNCLLLLLLQTVHKLAIEDCCW